MIYNNDAASKTSVKLVSMERLMSRQFLARRVSRHIQCGPLVYLLRLWSFIIHQKFTLRPQIDC